MNRWARMPRLLSSCGFGSGPSALRPSPGKEIDAKRLFVHMTRPAQRQPMFSKPLTCPSTLDRRAQLAGCGSDVRRGGALEPGALARMRRGTFLSQVGPRVRSELVQLSITSFIWFGLRTRNDEGDPFGSPSLQLSCAFLALAHAPRSEGLCRTGPPVIDGRMRAREFDERHVGLIIHCRTAR